MAYQRHRAYRLILVAMIIAVVFGNVVQNSVVVHAAIGSARFADIQSIGTSKLGVPNPGGFAFLPAAAGFLLWEQNTELTQTSLIKDYKHAGGDINLPTAVNGDLNSAYDPSSGSIFFLGSGSTRLTRVDLNSKGYPATTANSATKFDTHAYGVQSPAGITFDPLTGRLYILDAKGPRIVSVAPAAGRNYAGTSARISRMNVTGVGSTTLRGLAYNPKNTHLYAAAPNEKKIYEFDSQGVAVAQMDLANFN